MNLNPSTSRRNLFFLASSILSLMLLGCDTYQNVSYYDRDGVYSDFQEQPQPTQVTPENSSNNTYKEYFSSLQKENLKGEIFSDVEQYRNDSYNANDSTVVYTKSYPEWGGNTSQTNINFYGNNWGWGWNQYWGWNTGWNWNIGLGWGSWYGPYYGWGWDPWYAPYYGWGWNNWYPYGYTGYYQPAHYGTRSFVRSNYTQPSYNYNGVRTPRSFNNSGTRNQNSGTRNSDGYSNGNIRQNSYQNPRSGNIRVPNTNNNPGYNPRPDYSTPRSAPSESPRYSSPRSGNYGGSAPVRSGSGYSGGNYGGGGGRSGGRR